MSTSTDASQGNVLLTQDVVSLVLEQIGGLRCLASAARACRALRDGAAAKVLEWRVLHVQGSFGTQGAKLGELYCPNFVTTLPQGILVSDSSNCRLQLFSSEGTPLRTIGKFGIGEDQFHPRGTVSDGTALWVADTNRHRVQKLCLSDGSLLSSVGSCGSGKGHLSCPSGLALAGSTLAVTDASNHRIVLLNAKTMEWRSAFGERGSAPGQFNRPSDLAALDGTLLVVDTFNHRVQVFTQQGDFLRWFGGKGALPGQLQRPQGIAVSGGRVIVSECDGHRLQVLTPQGHPLQVLPLSFSTSLCGLCVHEHTQTLFAADFGKHVVHRIDVRRPRPHAASWLR